MTDATRIRIERDLDADLNYLEQGEFSDTDPTTIVSYGLVVEEHCSWCDSWNDTDAIWGCDVIDEWFLEGTYSVSDVPEPLRFALDHFTI